jgi:UDP-GlcNAc:undecaprenyl-phosphate/decaprenyl-phosphate GlcNAc-1-phosphate transferase
MRFPFVLALISFLASLALTPLFRALAVRWGLVDRPDGHRKLHSQPIAVSGGVPILLAVIIGVAVGAYVWPMAINPGGTQMWMLLGLLLGSCLICVVGIADDCGRLRGRHKLLGQMAAILAVVASGVLIQRLRFFEWEVELGLLAVPFTVFFLLGAVNSLNLIDGMDGLLSSVGLIVTLTFGFMAFLIGSPMATGVAFVLAGAILGFLRYNFPPASVFLGDAGSMLIGLIVGVLAIQCSLKGPATAALTAPLAVLVVPIFDTFVAILRRKLTGRSLYTTDRSHLHHCLQRHGMSSRKALLVISLLCVLTVAGALISLAFNNEIFALVGAAAVVCILVLTRAFGHAELDLLHQRLRGFMRGLLSGPASARASHVRLHGSLQWKDLMEAVVASSAALNLKTINLDVNAPALGESYHAHWDSGANQADEAALWRAEIPLALQQQSIGRLEVMGLRDAGPISAKLAQLAIMVQSFEAHLAMWGEAMLANRNQVVKAPAFTSKLPV